MISFTGIAVAFDFADFHLVDVADFADLFEHPVAPEFPGFAVDEIRLLHHGRIHQGAGLLRQADGGLQGQLGHGGAVERHQDPLVGIRAAGDQEGAGQFMGQGDGLGPGQGFQKGSPQGGHDHQADVILFDSGSGCHP